MGTLVAAMQRIAARPTTYVAHDLTIAAPTVAEQVHDFALLRNVATRRTEQGTAYALALDPEGGRVPWASVVGLVDTSAELRPGVTGERVLQRAHDIAQRGYEQVHASVERPRPYVLDPRLETLVTRPAMTAFPSWHTLHAYVNGGYIASVAPHAAAAAEQLAVDSALARIYAAVHNPTDTVAAARIANHAVGQAMREVGLGAAQLRLPPATQLSAYVDFGAVDGVQRLRDALRPAVAA